MSAEINKFSKNQQRAVLGHVLLDTKIWSQLKALGIEKTWFEGAPAQDLFDNLAKFVTTYKRSPTQQEFEEFLYNVDVSTYNDKKFTSDECLRLAGEHGIDILKEKLVDWAKSRLVATQAVELSALYNKGDHQAAFKVWEAGAVELQRIDSSAGAIPDHMESSNSRVSDEEVRRFQDGDKMLQYGVPFLDLGLCGIISNDLIMVGARTGAGKTELAKIVATHNAMAGKRVSFFALEGEDKEIERRIKFPYLVNYYMEDNQIPNAGFGYAEWRLGRYRDSLDTPEYKARAEEEFNKNFKTLKTYYRVRGSFGIEDLNREILLAAKESDLIVLDHLHFVDLDGRDENNEQKKLVMRLRELTTELNVPILCVAHLNKGANKNLVPELEDFMGSSNISKIATTCITLSACHDLQCTDLRVKGAPTYIRMAKFRLDGTRMPYIGMGFYNKQIGRYQKEYAIGRMNFGGTAWVPMNQNIPYWAQTEDLVTEISEM